ncbi:hypothetical protein [Metamycoplasma equirhinis]|uniref:hypothetical protein n=1 Tax=Metamycoplasma equirhinis TaxID=92402 RepID=UPI00359C12CB
MIDSYIPSFSEEKLKEILHYTDSNFNPTYESFKSNTFFELHSGAKGVSKSFGQAIITIYRIVNDKRFCSVWCRNQYNHIKKTLRPMFEKVLSFLKNEHKLDFTKCFSIYDSGLYWEVDDGGLGRAIYFENFEKIQAFQGITLKNNNFLFGELVLDEPIEDPSDTSKLPHQLEELYKLQEQKLPLLISNTIARLDAPEDFQIKVKFLYNIFTIDHWIIKKYHNQVIKILKDNNELNVNVQKELEQNYFIQKNNENFKENLGIICTMYSKYFIPKSQLGESQLKYLDSLKNDDYRLWIITVLGFAFQDENNKPNYFLEPYILNDKNKLNKFEIINDLNNIPDKSIVGVFDGFDPGLSDKSAWVRTLLLKDGQIVIWKAIDDLGAKLKQKMKRPRIAINNLLIDLIQIDNKKLLESGKLQNKSFNSLLLTDNDIICETLGLMFNQQNVNAVTNLANRRDTNSQKFGIVNRQNWQKFIFKNKLIIFTNKSLYLTNYLIKQIILPGEIKRDETINKEIYDLINAFEMSCSTLYQYQYYIQNKIAQIKGEKLNE